MDDQIKKAFDFASDSTKQLITLSTAILALTITFHKDVLLNAGSGSPLILTWAWIVYLISICLGIATLLALTGTLDPIKKAQNGSSTASIQGTNIRLLSAFQILSFLAGTSLVVASGAYAVSSLGAHSGDTTAMTSAKIDALRPKMLEALSRRDLATLEGNTTTNSIIVGPNGEVIPRSQFLADVSSGELKYESIRADNTSVHVYGNTVVETGYCLVRARRREGDIGGEFRYTATFVKADEGWRAVSLQITRLNATEEK